MSDDELRRAVLWCVEQLVAPETTEEGCGRCGHLATHHRLDDALDVSPDDPNAVFRCVYPMPWTGPAVGLCDCPDFVAGGTA